MDSRLLLIVVHLIAFTAAQEEESVCKCSSVIVMSQEELSQVIRSQVAVAIKRGGITAAGGPSAYSINQTVTNIVEHSMDKLFQNVEKLIKPITAKLEALEQPGVFPSHPAASCKDILQYDKTSRSDYYWLRASNGSAVKVYCDMTRTCGGITGGWMKVAQLDSTKNPHQCPHPLYLNTQHGNNLCARRETAGGCSEVHYQANGVAYSEVCGKVIGHQWGSPDGPYPGTVSGVNINGAYIDGVSITHSSPRQHIWTFIAAIDESGQSHHTTCPCSNRNSPGSSPPSFVGNDYFCDSGNKQRFHGQLIFYPNHPLWNGTGCGSNSDCCTFQNPPWFYKKLGASTSNSVDMRVCRDQVVIDENVLIEKVDIFVR